jgi:hypothetical protein
MFQAFLLLHRRIPASRQEGTPTTAGAHQYAHAKERGEVVSQTFITYLFRNLRNQHLQRYTLYLPFQFSLLFFHLLNPPGS